MVLSGGGAQLRNIDRLVTKETGVPVTGVRSRQNPNATVTPTSATTATYVGSAPRSATPR